MAENIYLKTRVSKIEMADPITELADVATAMWEELPLTLRDDAVTIIEADPEETEIFSHENDAAEDYDMIGKGKALTGSFIKATRAQLVDLLGGASAGADGAMRIAVSAQKVSLNKAIKLTLTNGGDVVIPNAKGYVLLNAGYGYSGVTKYPFKFKCLVAAPAWNVDIIL